MLPISNLWAGRLKTWDARRKNCRLAYGNRYDTLYATPVEIANYTAGNNLCCPVNREKGLHLAIEACRQLKEQGVSFRYRILGIGPWERRLRTLIEQYQLDDVIEMPGFKPSHQVKEMLEQADVFLLPSITGRDGDMEGIPVALMEAMAVGIPVISTVHSGSRSWSSRVNQAGWHRKTTRRHWQSV